MLLKTDTTQTLTMSRKAATFCFQLAWQLVHTCPTKPSMQFTPTRFSAAVQYLLHPRTAKLAHTFKRPPCTHRQLISADLEILQSSCCAQTAACKWTTSGLIHHLSPAQYMTQKTLTSVTFTARIQMSMSVIHHRYTRSSVTMTGKGAILSSPQVSTQRHRCRCRVRHSAPHLNKSNCQPRHHHGHLPSTHRLGPCSQSCRTTPAMLASKQHFKWTLQSWLASVHM